MRARKERSGAWCVYSCASHGDRAARWPAVPTWPKRERSRNSTRLVMQLLTFNGFLRDQEPPLLLRRIEFPCAYIALRGIPRRHLARGVKGFEEAYQCRDFWRGKILSVSGHVS